MKQRSIVLVSFPFSNQLGQKIRPALIISNDEFNHSGEDIIACAISSNIKLNKYSLLIDNTNLEEGILYESSCIKVESIVKLQKSLIIKPIAILDKETFSKVVFVINEIIK